MKHRADGLQTACAPFAAQAAVVIMNDGSMGVLDGKGLAALLHQLQEGSLHGVGAVQVRREPVLCVS